MERDDSTLSLGLPIKFLALFVLLVGVLMGGLSLADRVHKEAVYTQYANETNAYIEANRTTLVREFTQIFPDTPCYMGQTIPPCATVGIQEISTIPNTLKDWTSTLFLKRTPRGAIIAIKLSGDSFEFRANNAKDFFVANLLSGAVSSIPWDDYTYEFPGKEVIIPVKDTNGTIVGAIMRGVIE